MDYGKRDLQLGRRAVARDGPSRVLQCDDGDDDDGLIRIRIKSRWKGTLMILNFAAFFSKTFSIVILFILILLFSFFEEMTRPDRVQ